MGVSNYKLYSTLIMKNLILILIIFAAFHVSAQRYHPPKGWKSPELYLPATVLVSTFTVNQSIPMSLSTRNQIAITGFATSIATHFIFRQIRLSNKYCKFTLKL